MLKIEYAAIKIDRTFKPNMSQVEWDQFFSELDEVAVQDPSLILAPGEELKPGTDLTIGVSEGNCLMLELPDGMTCDFFPLVTLVCSEHLFLFSDTMHVYQEENSGDLMPVTKARTHTVRLGEPRITARHLMPGDRFVVIFGGYLINLSAKSYVRLKQEYLLIKTALSGEGVILPGSKINIRDKQ